MKSTLVFLFAVLSLSLSAQLNRYPYIQSTSQTSTIIAWKTANDVLGKVVYGLSPTSLLDTVYEANPVKRHALSLLGLEKNTTYYYTIFSDNQALASEYFTTASDSTDQDFSFIQYGDCGFNTSVQSTLGSLMEADDASFAVVCGDVDQGGVPHVSQSSGGDNYDDIFFNIYNNGTTHKMLSRECHYTAIGNHDVYANNGATYDLEFHLPHNNPDSSERYYSFTWGDAKFIALDVITPFDPTSFPINQKPISQRWWTDFRPGSPQYEFLVNELQCNDKKWVFIYFHEGPWTNYWGADYYLPNALGGDYYQFDGNTMVRQHLVPLFEQYGVDFVLCGHSHLYEQAEKNGVMYITSGGAGDVGGNTQYANHPEILKSIIQNHYIKFSVDGNTVSYDVINASNSVIDSFSLSKNYVEYQVNATISNVTCHGGVDGSISLNIQGPKAPYTVEWFDGSTGLTKSGLGAGTYYAYIKNAYNCEKVSSFTIGEPSIFTPEILSPAANFTFCAGDSIELYADQAYSTYIWSNGSNDSLTYLYQPGNIMLSVVDANGCLASTNSISIQEINLANPYFGFANNAASYNFLCGDPNASSYYWDFGDNSFDTTSTNTIIHSYGANGLYEVRLVVENECGTASYFREIEVD
ncbi:MAG: metallophosphoesterase [Chitinophagales bacterium]